MSEDRLIEMMTVIAKFGGGGFPIGHLENISQRRLLAHFRKLEKIAEDETKERKKQVARQSGSASRSARRR